MTKTVDTHRIRTLATLMLMALVVTGVRGGGCETTRTDQVQEETP